MPDLQLIAPLYFDCTLGLADEFILDQSKGIASDLDGLTLSLRFHTTCDVHSITPEVIDKFLAADLVPIKTPYVKASFSRVPMSNVEAALCRRTDNGVTSLASCPGDMPISS